MQIDKYIWKYTLNMIISHVPLFKWQRNFISATKGDS